MYVHTKTPGEKEPSSGTLGVVPPGSVVEEETERSENRDGPRHVVMSYRYNQQCRYYKYRRENIQLELKEHNSFWYGSMYYADH